MADVLARKGHFSSFFGSFLLLFIIYLFHHIRITLEDTCRIEDKYTSIQNYRLKIIIIMK